MASSHCYYYPYQFIAPVKVAVEANMLLQSVPPVWNALQSIWKWMDEELVEDPADAGDDRPIGERQAWWEKMVERLVEMEGVLSLC
jgi:hypothetical protein